MGNLPMKDRRKPVDHDIIMRVITLTGVIAIGLYGSLAACLVVAFLHGLRTGKWEMAVIGTLITAVATGAGNSSGFIGGILSKSFIDNTSTGEPVPVTVENNSDDRIPVETSAEEEH